jgi:MinD-like ATPase involved in chromosome partitioning or flagellar assembly
MMASRNAGIPLVQHAPRSKIHQSIQGLAEVLSGKASEADVKKKKSGFFSFA